MAPPTFLVELTHQCNLSCSYCYLRDVPHSVPSERALETQDWIALLDRLLLHQPAGITFLGGEPLLSPSLFDLAAHLSAQGVNVALSSNGTLIDPPAAHRIAACGVGHVELSLDSASDQITQSLCHTDVATVVRAAAALRSHGIPFTISAVLCQPALQGICALIDLAFAIGAASISLLRPLSPCNSLSPRLLPSHQDLCDALAIANDKAAVFGMPISVGMPLEPCLFSNALFPHLLTGPCEGAARKWTIDPAGNLRPCEALPITMGSLLTHSFPVLRDSPPAKTFRSTYRFPHCQSCDQVSRCGGGCRAIDLA